MADGVAAPRYARGTMVKLILKWLLSAAALLAVAYVYGGVAVASFGTALVAALLIGLLNMLVRPVLVVLGLLISVPIVVFGSTMVLKLVERFPLIIQLGAAVLAFTAAKMIVNEQWLAGVFGTREAPEQALRWAVTALAIVGVLGSAWLATRRKAAAGTDLPA